MAPKVITAQINHSHIAFNIPETSLSSKKHRHLVGLVHASWVNNKPS